MSFKEQVEEKKSEIVSKEYLSGVIQEAIRKEVGITEEEVSIESLDENVFSRAWNRLKSLFSTLDFNSLSFSAYKDGDIVYLFTEQDGSNYYYEIEGGEIVDSMERISANKYKTKMREVIQMGARQITSKRKLKGLFTNLNDKIQTDARFKFSPIRAVTGVMAATAAVNYDDIADMGLEVYDAGGDVVIQKTGEFAESVTELVDNIIDNMGYGAQMDYVKDFLYDTVPSNASQMVDTIKEVASKAAESTERHLELAKDFDFSDLPEMLPKISGLGMGQLEYLSEYTDGATREYLVDLFSQAGAAADFSPEYLDTLSMDDLEVLASQSQGVKDAMANMDQGERIQYATTLIQNAQ